MEQPYLHYLRTKYRFPRSLVHRPIQRFFTAYLEAMPPGARLLDAGCGDGIESGPYAGRLAVYGVDYQREYVAYCAARYPKATFSVADLQALPYPSDFFDTILLNQVLEHLAQPQLVIAELARVLRPGGLFLAATPNYGNFGWPLVENTYHRFFAKQFEVDEVHVTPYDAATMRAHLSTDLECLDVHTVCASLILVGAARKTAA